MPILNPKTWPLAIKLPLTVTAVVTVVGFMIGAVMVFHDVSKESRLFRQLSYQASHDAVTGLINRREFENRLVEALEGTHENNENSLDSERE